MTNQTIIAWDLGGTKCTAGILTANKATQELICKKSHTIKLREASSLTDLTQQIEQALDYKMSEANAICIGAAGHFDGRTIQHANPYPFQMTIAEIAEQQHWPAYFVVHDYASIVCSTFTHYINQSDNIHHLNQCKANPYGRRVAFGIGTGLGLKDGVLFPNGDFWLGHNEMGHIGISTPPLAETQDKMRHHELVNFLHDEFHGEAVTFEKVLSGYGMVRLYRFLHPAEKNISPEEVGVKIQSEAEQELADLFAWYSGLFVGTVQLSFMPSGGIFMTGGVALNHQHLFNQSGFKRGIHATPAYLTQRKEYPLALLRNPLSALYGCGYYALNKL